MDYITTTNLRTQSRKLIDTLKQGKKVSLIHRSKIVGEILPVKTEIKTFNIQKFREFVKETKVKIPSYSEGEKNYRKHLEKKYGKSIS